MLSYTVYNGVYMHMYFAEPESIISKDAVIFHQDEIMYVYIL